MQHFMSKRLMRLVSKESISNTSKLRLSEIKSFPIRHTLTPLQEFSTDIILITSVSFLKIIQCSFKLFALTVL